MPSHQRKFTRQLVTQKIVYSWYSTITRDSIQNQSRRGVFRKSCFENMLQIYRRRPIIPKCDFNKVAKQLRYRCSPVNLLYISRAPFFNNASGWLLLSVYHPIIALFKNKKKFLKNKKNTLGFLILIVVWPYNHWCRVILNKYLGFYYLFSF